MIPSEYTSFLTASTQASAALIGLLFVSVSIAPERTFGHEAEAGRQALAVSSFTALANVFFVSFGSLIPNLTFGLWVVIAGMIAAAQTLALLASWASWRRERILVRSLALFLASAVIYAYEIAIGFRLISSPADAGALTALLQLLLAGYAIGLARAWELLGAPYVRGPISGLSEWLGSRLGRPAGTESKPPAPEGPTPKPAEKA